MRGGALPPALICAALGFALAYTTPAARRLGLALLVVAALAASFLTLPVAWQDGVFLGCWTSVALAALAIHLPRGIGPRLAAVLAVNAGVWAGAVIASAGSRWDLVKALPAVLLCFPAAWLVSTGRGIAVKVAASWLIAIAILAAALPLVPTPGYKPDHMD